MDGRRVGSRGLQRCEPGHRPGVNVIEFLKGSTWFVIYPFSNMPR